MVGGGLSWGSSLGAKWFLLSGNRSDEAWLIICHSIAIILTTTYFCIRCQVGTIQNNSCNQTVVVESATKYNYVFAVSCKPQCSKYLDLIAGRYNLDHVVRASTVTQHT